MFKLNLNPFYAAEDSSGAGANTEELSKEDVITLLDEDIDEEKIELEKPKKEEVKEEEEEEEKEEDDLKELEEELEEPDAEKLELMTPVRRKEILKAYPDLFKKFPYLERAYYREQQFTELLPTIEDAKEAVEKSRALDNFERDLMKGNTETILKAVKDNDQNSFYKIVDDYLPTLQRVDEKAYFHVLGSVIKSTITSMVQESRKSNNEALQSAAHLLNQFVFGTSDFEQPTKLAKEETKPEEDVLKKKEQEFNRRQYETAQNDLSTRIDNVLKSTIQANIDPKESMTEYVRKNATREALESLQDSLRSDTRLKVIIDKLWERAFADGFTKPSVDKIKSAYLSRAKTLLPTVIKKARNEALKGLGKRVVDDSDEKESPEKTGHSQASTNKGKTKQEIKPKKSMSTLDYLMQD